MRTLVQGSTKLNKTKQWKTLIFSIIVVASAAILTTLINSPIWNSKFYRCILSSFLLPLFNPLYPLYGVVCSLCIRYSVFRIPVFWFFPESRKSDLGTPGSEFGFSNPFFFAPVKNEFRILLPVECYSQPGFLPLINF